MARLRGINYDIFNSDKDLMFQHSELNPAYDKQLVMKLQPGQYSELVDKYSVIQNHCGD